MRRFVRVGLVGAALAALTGVAPVASATAQAGPTVRMAITQNDKNWTPYTYQTGYPGYNVLTLLYDTLLWHDKDNRLIPWLAKEYKVSPDGMNIDVTLRDGVRWHDGQALTADDVKFTYDYVQQFNHGRFTPEVKGIVQSTSVTGPNTLTFRLVQPSASFPTSMADVTILPRHIWEPISEAYPSVKGEQGLAVGSGPYKMVAYDPDKQYRLQANDAYFMGKPAVPEIVLQIIPGADPQILALRGGEVDVIAPNLPPEQAKELPKQQGIAVATGPDYTSSALTFNASRAPFDQVKFRQAVGYAIDVDDLVRNVLLGVGVPGSPGFIHPDSGFFKKGLKHEFNPGKANALLDELGYTGRDGTTRQNAAGKKLEFEILATSTNPIEVRTAEVVGSMLGQVGIKVTVTAVTGAAKAARTGGFGGQTPDRDFDMQMTGATAPVQDDPDKLRTFLESWNPTTPNLNSGKWSNPQFDALLKQQAVELDAAKRLALISQMQDIIATDRPTVTLYYRNGAYAYRNGAYPGWVYVRGKGIVDKLSFVSPPEERATATTSGSNKVREEGSGSSAGVIVAVVVALIILGAVALAVRRRKAPAERE
jgi:peptide/nickel transport system substrate-binding protein